MNSRSWFKKTFWRLPAWESGLLEGDHGWATARLYLMIAGSLLPVLAGILLEMLLNVEKPATWLEQLVQAEQNPQLILRLIGTAVHWTSFRYMLVPAIAISISLMVGAHYIQDIYELPSYQQAFWYLLSSLFGFRYEQLRIDGGKKQIEPGEVNTLDAIGGPGYVFISPGNVVLFERLTHPSAVRAEGLHFISRFESIKEIIDLGDQHGYIEKSSAMSKDGIVVTVHEVQFRYRLWGGWRVTGSLSRTPQHPYPFSVQAVRDLVYSRAMSLKGLGAWNDAVKSAVEGEILNYIRTHLVDDVTAPKDSDRDPRNDIRKSLFSTAVRGRMKSIGTELMWFDIGRFSFEDPAIEEQRISTWSADWIGNAEVIRAYGEAQRQAWQEMARAQAQAELVLSLVYSLHEAGLAGNLRGEGFSKLFLMKVGQILDDLSTASSPRFEGE